MANYATLKAAIESTIRTNGQEEITGQILQNAIIALIESLGAEFQFAGVASTSTNPGTPDHNVMYIAGAGTYPNFGGTEVEKGHIGVFAYNGSWNNVVVETGAYFEFQEYPSGDAIEFTFYDSENTDGKTIKINKTVSGISNAPDEAISQWWAAQIQRKIQDVQGFTDNFTSLSTTEQSLGLFGIIKTGKVIDSITGVNKLIFIDDESNEYTVNTTDLPYVAPADFVSVKLQSGTASNVSINVRGDNDVLISHININEIANHPTAYTSAALALNDVPTLYRRKGMKVVYYDDTLSLWVEMLNVDDAGANWWTDVTNNWVIEGPIETELPTNTGGQQLRVGGTKRGNLDDVLNVNVWNNQATEYSSKDNARAAVPANKRKLGAIITYLVSTGADTSGWMIDEFTGSSISDWAVTDNWQTIGPVSVSQNTETGHTDISVGGVTTPVASMKDLALSIGVNPFSVKFNQEHFIWYLDLIDRFELTYEGTQDLSGYDFMLHYISYNSYAPGYLYFQLRCSNDGWATNKFGEKTVAKTSLRAGEIIEGDCPIYNTDLQVHFKLRISKDYPEGSSFANSSKQVPVYVALPTIAEAQLKTNTSDITSLKGRTSTLEGKVTAIENAAPKKEIKIGTNLYDYANRRVGYVINSDGSFSEIGEGGDQWALVNYANVQGLENIIFGRNGVTPTNWVYNYAFYDSSKNYIANSYVKPTPTLSDVSVIAVPEGAAYFCACVVNSTGLQINAGTTILPYEDYSQYYYTGQDEQNNDWKFKPDTEDEYLTEKIQNMISANQQISTTPLLPQNIYTVCNDLSSDIDVMAKRNYSVNLYLDHLFILSSHKSIRFKETQRDILPIFSKYQNTPSEVWNMDGSNVKSVVKSVHIDGNGDSAEATFTHISTRLSATRDAFPKILCIGDSVTQGLWANINAPYDNSPYQYWEWMKALFDFDSHQANNPNYYRAIFLGTKQVDTFIEKYFDGTTLQGRACAEGNGGTSAQSYLTQQTHGDAGINPFYDPNKAGTAKFSVAYWLSHYRTMDDNGNRLYFDANQGTTGTAGSTNIGYLADGTQTEFYIGSEVTDTMAYDVCQPTHIIIQLGYNDANNDTYTSNMQTIVSIIQSELPNCFIGLSLPDCPGTYFPEFYPNSNRDVDDQYPVSYFQDPTKSSHEKFYSMTQKLMSIEDIPNKVYYIPNYFVSPTADAAPSRVSQNAMYLSSNSEKDLFKIQGPYAAPYLHPNNHAHAVWGYENYSWVKYTLTL